MHVLITNAELTNRERTDRSIAQSIAEAEDGAFGCVFDVQKEKCRGGKCE